ncbi:hypothetical protein PWT90_02810 [Aphanocladium album]|nr:hypothetical protein PWT90_02810 [Aphanocladium album]
MGVAVANEKTSSGSLDDSHDNGVLETSPVQEVPVPAGTTERRILTKIDLHVVPFLCIMYLLAFLDRVNIANAKVFDLAKDLHLEEPGTKDSTKYNTALVIFFVPYCLFEIPSNILLKKFKPHVWLSINMFLFGFTTIMQGLVTNYSGLLATRFFLGVFETGMFPGAAFYLIGMWYKRSEAQKRYSFFFNSTTLAGAFGGLLAAAIGKMDGMRGYKGWRWIFIIEGALTVFVSFFIWFLLPDFPEDVKWLSEEERTYVKARLAADQGNHAIERPIKLRDVLSVLKDPKVIAGGFAYFGIIVPAYGYAYFAPGILQTFHYGKIETQLRSVPPWAVAFAFSMAIAYTSDRIRHRFLFTLATISIAIAGFAILLGVHDHTNVQYAALFLIASGAYTAMPIIVCWFNMNLGGHHRRAIGSAWQVGFGNLGGIIAVYVFLQRDSPRFIPGYSVCLAWFVLSAISCCVYAFLCWNSNKKRAMLPPDAGAHLTQEEKDDLGDNAPDYRYLL